MDYVLCLQMILQHMCERYHLRWKLYSGSQLIKIYLDKDLLLGNIYIPPPSSPYASDDMFMDLEMSLLDLNYINYHVMLVGDFNAHTSMRADYIDLQEDLRDELELSNCTDILESYNCRTDRSNRDKTKCDVYGNKLLQLCQAAGFSIFNGRLKGDESEQYTTDRNATIDYVLGSPNLLKYLTGMKVDEFNSIFSDVHCKIKVEFNTKMEISTSVRTDTESRKLNRWMIFWNY